MPMRRLCYYQGKLGHIPVYLAFNSCIIWKKQKVLSSRKTKDIDFGSSVYFILIFLQTAPGNQDIQTWHI